jgi:hypothetical protein
MDDNASEVTSITRAVTGDWALHRLAWLADQGFPLSITVVIDGAVIGGDTAKPEEFMDPLDSTIRDLLVRAEQVSAQAPPDDPAALAEFEGMTPGDFALVREQFEEGAMFSPVLAERRAHDERMRADVEKHEQRGTPAEELPDDVVRWLQTRHRPMPALTLRDAVLTTPGAGPVVLPSPVRVVINKVSLWWVGRAPHPSPPMG